MTADKRMRILSQLNAKDLLTADQVKSNVGQRKLSRVLTLEQIIAF